MPKIQPKIQFSKVVRAITEIKDTKVLISKYLLRFFSNITRRMLKIIKKEKGLKVRLSCQIQNVARYSNLSYYQCTCLGILVCSMCTFSANYIHVQYIHKSNKTHPTWIQCKLMAWEMIMLNIQLYKYSVYVTALREV